MKFLKFKKGYGAHPGWMFLIGLLIGLVLAYLWVNYTGIPNPFCAVTTP